MLKFTYKNGFKILVALIFSVLLLTVCACGKTQEVYTSITENGISIGDYFDVRAIGDGYFAVTNDDFSVGIINNKGEVLLPCEYNSVRDISDGVIGVRAENGWGYYNPELKKFIVDCISKEIYDFKEGLGLYLDGEEYRFVLPDGSDAFGDTYFEAVPFCDGLARVFSREGVGYINKSGEFDIYCDFEHFDDFYEGFARYSDGDTFGYMNKDGNSVFTVKANSIYPYSEGLAQFVINSKAGYLDDKGDIIESIKVGSMPENMAREYYGFTFGVAPFLDKETGKYGFINKQGDIVVDPLYSMVMYACDGIMRVRAEDKLYGFISAKGDIVSECVFDTATAFSDGTATVSDKDGYYFINAEGKPLTEERFLDATEFSGCYAAIFRDGSWYIIEKS